MSSLLRTGIKEKSKFWGKNDMLEEETTVDWRGRSGSDNVEDRRGMGVKGMTGIGGGFALILYIVFSLLGVDPGAILENRSDAAQPPGQNAPYTQQYKESPEEKEAREFVSVVFKDTEDVWTNIFQQNRIVYRKPTLVLYKGAVDSACGLGQSAMGPFYCSGDTRVYLDLNFYGDLRSKFQAPGDFAMAYVIAHEVGHHVQNLLGTMEKVQSLRSTMSEKQFNQYLVRLELQADYYAGVWTKHIQGKGYLEQGDIDEALKAASAVGDDRLQKQTKGHVTPDSFTHGTSEQRMRWFKLGYQNGTIQGGETFNALNL